MNDLVQKIERIRSKKPDHVGCVDPESYQAGFFDAIRGAKKLVEEHSPWTPADTPPEEDGEYFVIDYRGSGHFDVFGFDHKLNLWSPFRPYLWMETPAPPKEAEL